MLAILARIPSDFLPSLWLAAPSQLSEIPTTVIGLVGTVVVGSLGFAGLIYRNQLIERKEHRAEIERITTRYDQRLEEQAKRHEDAWKILVDRQAQFEGRLVDLLVAVNTTQKESAAAIQGFISLRDIQEEIRGRGNKAVR